MEYDDHHTCVDAWLEGAVRGKPTLGMIDAFEAAFSALWRRAHDTLGEVTLVAIVKRVLLTAAEQCSLLSTLALDGAELECNELRAVAPSVQPQQLADGFRFVLVEFMTVIGNLTADILTPALHEALRSASESGPHE
jgi:hypothetical protein